MVKSPIIVTTSSLFGMCAIIALINGHSLAAIGMFIVSLTSVWTHAVDSRMALTTDLISNLCIGALFTLVAAMQGLWSVVWCSLIALLSFITLTSKECSPDALHAALVHIPVIVGFLIIATGPVPTAETQSV